MIELKQLRQLIKLMVDNELSELDLHDGDERVSLKRGAAGVPQVVQAAPQMAPAVAAAAPAAAPAASDAASSAATDGLVEIPSPMVGTFYTASSPDAEAFVSVGSSVGAETPVCIIEAMKVFNEIKAEISGTIEKILVENGQAVEFEQPLFLVKPS